MSNAKAGASANNATIKTEPADGARPAKAKAAAQDASVKIEEKNNGLG